MPRQDGAEPIGRGLGQCSGRGRGRGQKVGGARMGGRGLGPSGECVCPNCGTKASHERGIPCYKMKCPSCGTAMTRA